MTLTKTEHNAVNNILEDLKGFSIAESQEIFREVMIVKKTELLKVNKK